MKSKVIYLLSLICVLFSCSSKENEQVVIPSEKYQITLTGLNNVEVLSNSRIKNEDIYALEISLYNKNDNNCHSVFYEYHENWYEEE